MIRNFEFYTGRSSGRLYKFEVLITTFELVLKDAPTLGKVKWNYLMVDEAHRLKNHEAALYQARPQRSQPAAGPRSVSFAPPTFVEDHLTRKSLKRVLKSSCCRDSWQQCALHQASAQVVLACLVHVYDGAARAAGD